jgi:hypothetical protein
MAAYGKLKEWVFNKLMSLLSYSKNVVVQYAIRLGTRHLLSSFLFILLNYVPLFFVIVLTVGSHACIPSEGVLFNM